MRRSPRLGISAFSGEERPDFDRMIADCRAGRLNVIIVYHVSRFSRLEVADALPVVTELLNMGVSIVSITEGTFKRDDIMDLIQLIFRLDAAHQDCLRLAVSVLGRGAADVVRPCPEPLGEGFAGTGIET